MLLPDPYTIAPLGDSALLVDFGNMISDDINEKVLRLFYCIQQEKNPAITDLVPAYSSLAVYYEVSKLRQAEKSAFEVLAEWIERLDTSATQIVINERMIRVPVCYEPRFAIDLEEISKLTGLEKNQVIELHTSCTYHIYMMGFLPGFAYMGETHEKLYVPRRSSPRVKVSAGSVGIAGRQTGIYPFESPGGWQIIGRTPMVLFEPAKEMPVVLKAGDRVQFYSISSYEFDDLEKRHT